MSASPAPAPLRPPAESRLRVGLKLGVVGLTLGLLLAALFIIPHQRPANHVLKVFSEARAALLTQRFEHAAWPADGELVAGLSETRARRLGVLIAECPLEGAWRLEGTKSPSGPAIVFTPAEPGVAFERCLRLVDEWIDDGEPAAGEFRFGPDRAQLRLSAE